jgi:hypothetical protein
MHGHLGVIAQGDAVLEGNVQRLHCILHVLVVVQAAPARTCMQPFRHSKFVCLRNLAVVAHLTADWAAACALPRYDGCCRLY